MQTILDPNDPCKYLLLLQYGILEKLGTFITLL